MNIYTLLSMFNISAEQNVRTPGAQFSGCEEVMSGPSSKAKSDEFNSGLALQRTSTPQEPSNTSQTKNNIKDSQPVDIKFDADFDESGRLVRNEKVKNGKVSGAITYKDSNGQEIKIPITVAINVISAVDNSGLTHKAHLSRITSELKTSINELPQDVKSDLHKECSGISLQQGSDGSANVGEYDRSTNEIFLFYKGSAASRLAPNFTGTIAHEIGHAVDENQVNYKSKELDEEFNKFRELLIKKGMVKKEEVGKGDFYPLNHVNEFFAEAYSFDAVGEKSNHKTVYQKIEASQDPEVQSAYKSLRGKFQTIVTESRSKTREQRMSADYKSVIEKHAQGFIDNFPDSVKEAHDRLIFSDSALDCGFLGNPKTLYTSYYEYKQGTLKDENAKFVFSSLNECKDADWMKLKEHMDKTLSSLGL